MNFQNLSKIEKPEFYVGKALREAIKAAASKRTSPSMRGRKRDISANLEEKKVIVFTKTLVTDLDIIEKSFPSIDNLPVFYQELIEVTISKDRLKKAINTVSWIKKKTIELSKHTLSKIKIARSIQDINQARKEFFGRASSLLNRRKKELGFLEDSRKKMRAFPSIKENIKTVCICGYPNVGKSTLLTKITTAKPEINIYPFTTKGLMMGYISNKVQVIDAPGTFGSDFLKMNNIEKQSYLALKYLAEVIIFVFDLSESCGYEVDLQERLLKELKTLFKHKKLIIYLSKMDMIEPEKAADFKKRYAEFEVISEHEMLKSILLKD